MKKDMTLILRIIATVSFIISAFFIIKIRVNNPDMTELRLLIEFWVQWLLITAGIVISLILWRITKNRS